MIAADEAAAGGVGAAPKLQAVLLHPEHGVTDANQGPHALSETILEPAAEFMTKCQTAKAPISHRVAPLARALGGRLFDMYSRSPPPAQGGAAVAAGAGEFDDYESGPGADEAPGVWGDFGGLPRLDHSFLGAWGVPSGTYTGAYGAWRTKMLSLQPPKGDLVRHLGGLHQKALNEMPQRLWLRFEPYWCVALAPLACNRALNALSAPCVHVCMCVEVPLVRI